MRSIRFSILILTTCLAPGWGQNETRYSGHAYLFGAPGGISGESDRTLHFGGGAEGLVFKGLAVGGELGYLTPVECPGCGIGMLSANGSYHFVARTPGRKVVPFVTAGYTLAFRNGLANMYNFGGGVQYWFSRRVGLRAEVRDHVSTCSSYTIHLWGVRFGLAFR
jgi:hypothetical protein